VSTSLGSQPYKNNLTNAVDPLVERRGRQLRFTSKLSAFWPLC